MHGMFAHIFLGFDDPRLEPLGEPIDVIARRGQGVLFSGMMLHGSSNPGDSRRVSCDMRFFPLSPFLPSPIHTLGDRPLAALRDGLGRAGHDELRAAFLASMIALGQDVEVPAAQGRSTLHWPAYLQQTFSEENDLARSTFESFVNTGFGIDGVEPFLRHHGRELQVEPLRDLLGRLRKLEPNAPELGALERHLEFLADLNARRKANGEPHDVTITTSRSRRHDHDVTITTAP